MMRSAAEQAQNMEISSKKYIFAKSVIATTILSHYTEISAGSITTKIEDSKLKQVADEIMAFTDIEKFAFYEKFILSQLKNAAFWKALRDKNHTCIIEALDVYLSQNKDLFVWLTEKITDFIKRHDPNTGSPEAPIELENLVNSCRLVFYRLLAIEAATIVRAEMRKPARIPPPSTVTISQLLQNSVEEKKTAELPTQTLQVPLALSEQEPLSQPPSPLSQCELEPLSRTSSPSTSPLAPPTPPPTPQPEAQPATSPPASQQQSPTIMLGAGTLNPDYIKIPLPASSQETRRRPQPQPDTSVWSYGAAGVDLVLRGARKAKNIAQQVTGITPKPS